MTTFHKEFTLQHQGGYVDEDWVRKFVIPVLDDHGAAGTGARRREDWHLTIPGEPIAKARPKLGTVNGHAMAFTPAKTRRYEDVIRQRATLNWNRPLLADVPVTLSVTFFRGIPQSWPKKKREAALLGEIRPLGRPDWDNFGKLCSDAMNGVVYLDDGLIVDATVRKFYALEPRVEISLSW